jgi:hypothetical protein
MKETGKKVRLLRPVDADTIPIGRDNNFPSVYIIDLPLDSTPDHVWQSIFEEEWKSSRNLWDRKLFVIGDKLRLLTTSDELEEKLDWVEQVVERTNKGIDEYHKQAESRAAEIEEQMRKQLLDEQARVEKIRNTLRQRFG